MNRYELYMQLDKWYRKQTIKILQKERKWHIYLGLSKVMEGVQVKAEN